LRALTTLTLPTLWAIAVLAGAWRWRPAPTRLLGLVESGAIRSRPSPVRRLGGVIRRALHRSEDPGRDRQTGWAAIGTCLALLVSPLAAVAVVALSVLSATAADQRQRRRREEIIRSSVPDTIDLFVLVAGAGHPVRRSVELVAVRAGGPVGRELRAVARRVAHGDRTADALEGAGENLGESVRPLVKVLCASERYGTPLVPALERLAIEARNDRRRRAEEAARRVPVKLLFPLVLCTLPAFALLTVVPLLVGAFGSLRL
jgi:Flp pilus assembly protein TadB